MEMLHKEPCAAPTSANRDFNGLDQVSRIIGPKKIHTTQKIQGRVWILDGLGQGFRLEPIAKIDLGPVGLEIRIDHFPGSADPINAGKVARKADGRIDLGRLLFHGRKKISGCGSPSDPAAPTPRRPQTDRRIIARN